GEITLMIRIAFVVKADSGRNYKMEKREDLNKKLRLRKDKFIVAEATKLDKEILKIKASVSGLSIHDYVNRAIRDHTLESVVPEDKCHKCNATLELRHYDDVEFLQIRDIDHEIKLKNIPYAECPK